MSEAHECVFVEEREPSGRLILPPCLVCELTAMDALAQLRDEAERVREEVWREAHERFCGKSTADNRPPTKPAETEPRETEEQQP